VVEAALNSANPVLHTAGFSAFCKWPDASVADKLLALVEQPKNAEERQDAFKAFVRVSSMRGDERSDAERLKRLKQAMELAKTTEEQGLVLSKLRLAYTVESMRFALSYLDQSEFTAAACEAIVELAHHREIREPHKAEFDKALDRVLMLSKDDVVKDRATRYKAGQTWLRPTKSSE
jgi:hypothetical protein